MLIYQNNSIFNNVLDSIYQVHACDTFLLFEGFRFPYDVLGRLQQLSMCSKANLDHKRLKLVPNLSICLDADLKCQHVKELFNTPQKQMTIM